MRWLRRLKIGFCGRWISDVGMSFVAEVDGE